MTPEQIVRTRYPEACAQQHPLVAQTGPVSASTPESWVVYAGGGRGPALGEGPSAPAAWQAAAHKVRVDTCMAKTQLWVNYLLAQGYRRQPDDANQLVQPGHSEFSARVNPGTGTLHLSPKLAELVAGLADSRGNPPVP